MRCAISASVAEAVATYTTGSPHSAASRSAKALLPERAPPPLADGARAPHAKRETPARAPHKTIKKAQKENTVLRSVVDGGVFEDLLTAEQLVLLGLGKKVIVDALLMESARV